MRLLAAAGLAGAFLLASCGSSPPPPASIAPLSPSYNLACWSVPQAACEPIATELMRRMAGSGDVVAITVTAFGCEAVRCPPGFEARTHGEALVELANPSRIRELAITSVNGGIAFGPVVKASSAVLVPATARAGKGNLPFSLGHCGLGSPIDVDGSLWDPVGQIDGDATDVVNSSNGTILFLGQQTARFETSGGFRADLVRRAGSKAYRLCS